MFKVNLTPYFKVWILGAYGSEAGQWLIKRASKVTSYEEWCKTISEASARDKRIFQLKQRTTTPFPRE